VPIASEVIEGACRHLVKDRMERSGMRWTIESAQAMLDVRRYRPAGGRTPCWRCQAKESHARQRTAVRSTSLREVRSLARSLLSMAINAVVPSGKGRP